MTLNLSLLVPQEENDKPELTSKMKDVVETATTHYTIQFVFKKMNALWAEPTPFPLARIETIE